jgi:hypothetical protein
MSQLVEICKVSQAKDFAPLIDGLRFDFDRVAGLVGFIQTAVPPGTGTVSDVVTWVTGEQEHIVLPL